MLRILLGSFLSLACMGQTPQQAAALKASDIDADLTKILLTAKRVYVESFGEDTISKSLQAMLVDAFRSTKRFIITENKDRADLFLKGTALEKTSQELHALGSAVSVAGASANRHSAGAHQASTADSQTNTETINDARASVRLVSKDGDVVWSTTQESTGAKYKGSTADVADKAVKQLLRDIAKLEKESGK